MRTRPQIGFGPPTARIRRPARTIATPAVCGDRCGDIRATLNGEIAPVSRGMTSPQPVKES
jgi:hypothetical protein